jgi:toxin FitB
MNVVDSSAWLEYFADGPNASFFAKPIERTEDLIVPSLAIYEVFKRVLQQRNETDALRAVALMEQGRVVPLDAATALSAARISLDHQLPMADSVMLATTRAFGATLWTQDTDFEGLPGVQYRESKR